MSQPQTPEPTITDYHRAARQIKAAIEYSRCGAPVFAQRRLQAALLVVDGRTEEYVREAQAAVVTSEGRYAMRQALQLLGAEMDLATVGFEPASEVES